MGFGTSHVFKTTNAGASWTDKNGDLPDSPANSVVVDPTDPNIIYVGTDVGVFVSIDDGATWADFGSGMPNVPVVKLKTFVASGVKKLRAATYGRGMWQTDLAKPDINFAGSTLAFTTVLGRSSATKQTTLTNNTAVPITIGNISANGEFTVASNCPTVLNPGVSCQVSVVFSPMSAGLRTNSLVLTSSAGMRTLPLTGNGIDFTLSLVRPARPMRSAANGATISSAQKAMFEVSANASNGLDGLEPSDTHVNLECAAPRRIQCSLEPSTIDLAQGPGSVLVTIRARPSGSLRLRSRGKGSLAPGNYGVQLRAVSGMVVRMLDFPVIVR
jgi:hypothetical protein